MATNEHVRAFWRQRIEAQRASGLSVTAWCFQQDISLPTFYYWRKRVIEATPAAGPQWVAVLPLAPVTPALTLRVGRVAVDVPAGFDPRLLADVLTVLEGR